MSGRAQCYRARGLTAAQEALMRRIRGGDIVRVPRYSGREVVDTFWLWHGNRQTCQVNSQVVDALIAKGELVRKTESTYVPRFASRRTL